MTVHLLEVQVWFEDEGFVVVVPLVVVPPHA